MLPRQSAHSTRPLYKNSVQHLIRTPFVSCCEKRILSRCIVSTLAITHNFSDFSRVNVKLFSSSKWWCVAGDQRCRRTDTQTSVPGCGNKNLFFLVFVFGVARNDGTAYGRLTVLRLVQYPVCYLLLQGRISSSYHEPAATAVVGSLPERHARPECILCS